jgi:hypothetical protein
LRSLSAVYPGLISGIQKPLSMTMVELYHDKGPRSRAQGQAAHAISGSEIPEKHKETRRSDQGPAGHASSGSGITHEFERQE